MPTVYTSRNNGRGPHAWNHHWLMVPLRDRSGALLGFLWADDPVDRLLPGIDEPARAARLRQPRRRRDRGRPRSSSACATSPSSTR